MGLNFQRAFIWRRAFQTIHNTNRYREASPAWKRIKAGQQGQGQSWREPKEPSGVPWALQIPLSLRFHRGTLPYELKACPANVQSQDNVLATGMLTRPAGLLPSSSGNAGGCPSPAKPTPEADQIRELRAATTDFSKRAVMLSVNQPLISGGL